LFVHRFRQTDDRENIEFFREDGVELLDGLRVLIENREMSQEFVHNWGKLMYSFGFISVGVFAATDDAAHARAVKAGGAARERKMLSRKVWVAKVTAHYLKPRMALKAAHSDAACHVKRLQSRSDLSSHRDWYADLLDDTDLLKKTFRKIKRSEVEQLAKVDDLKLPPLGF
jgi:hypothetical protein